MNSSSLTTKGAAEQNKILTSCGSANDACCWLCIEEVPDPVSMSRSILYRSLTLMLSIVISQKYIEKGHIDSTECFVKKILLAKAALANIVSWICCLLSLTLHEKIHQNFSTSLKFYAQ